MIRHSLYRFLSAASLILMLLSPMSPARAQTTPAVTVHLAPAAIEIPLGQTVDAAVEVIDVQDLYGLDITAKFDPTIIEVVDADPASAGVQVALGTFLDAGFAVLNTVDNTTGTMRFAMTQLNPSEPKSGTGALIVIRLRGKQVSNGTPLTLTTVQLAKRDGTSLSTNPVSGVISVVSSAGSAPISTPIPTQGTGTLMPTLTPTSNSTVIPPTVGSATGQSGLAPGMTGQTVTPAPPSTPGSSAAAASTPAANATAPATTDPASNSAPKPAALEATVVPPASAAAAAANTLAAVAAISVSSATPNAIQAAIQVTEPATPAAISPGSGMGLLAMSGILGIAGIITVFLVTRRRPH